MGVVHVWKNEITWLGRAVSVFLFHGRGAGILCKPEGKRIGNNSAAKSQDPQKRDFRPASILVDKAREAPGITDGFKGTAQNIGAYEQGGDFWIPGADWKP